MFYVEENRFHTAKVEKKLSMTFSMNTPNESSCYQVLHMLHIPLVYAAVFVV